ncbi:MAG: tetratricopeptide repeat protein [Candidatus Hodarchaeales archaeon]|jgi:tetratricopeptide (TPR) repeat protein
MSFEEFDGLIIAGEFDKAAALIDAAAIPNSLKDLAFKTVILVYQDKFREAIELGSEVVRRGKETEDRVIVLYAVQYVLYAYLLTNRFKKFAQFAKETEPLLDLDENGAYNLYNAQELVSIIYTCHGSKEMYTGQIDAALNGAKKGLALGEELESPLAICAALWILSLAHQQDKAQAGKALEYANRLLSIAQKHSLNLCLAWAYHALISCHRQLGDLDKSSKYANLGVPLGKKMGWKWITDMMMGEVGHQYFERGEYTQALEHFQHAFSAAQERTDYWQMAVHLINMGHVYRAKGELQSALDAFQQLHFGASMIKNRFYQSYASHAMGTIYFDQGAFDDALKMFQESLQLRDGFRNKAHLATSLLSLIQLSIELNNLNTAREYFSKLEEARAAIPYNKNFQTNYEFAKALLLKSSPRMRQKAEAQAIFEKIANDEENRHSAITSALLNLLDLLVYEYKSAEEPQILEEVNSLSQRLITISRAKNDHRIVVKALILQGKLTLLEGNLQKGEQLLGEAYDISEKVGFQILRDQAEQEQERIRIELEKWEALLARNAPLRERLEQAKLAEYIRDALRVMSDEVIT